MLGELGQFTLVLALILSIAQFVIPLVGLQKNNTAMMHFARSATYAQFLIVALSYAILTYGFYLNDFQFLTWLILQTYSSPWYTGFLVFGVVTRVLCYSGYLCSVVGVRWLPDLVATFRLR